GQFWGHWRQVRLDSLAGQLQVPAIELDLPRPAQPIENLQLRFNLQLADREQRLDIEQASLLLGEQRWPDTRLQLSRDPQQGDWQARIDRIRLDLLGQWLPAVLPHERAAEILAALAPEGELHSLLLSGAGLDEFEHWSIQAGLHRVALQGHAN